MIAARQAESPDDTSMFVALDAKLGLLADDLAWWTGALAAGRDGTAT